MNFAPVIIPTLSRYGHFKNCVESLRLCKYSNNTDLFIFLDYPSKESHWDGYENIKKYLPTIKGFKSINIIERKRNFGAVDNFFKSVEYVLERSDRLIFSEDDNVFSPDFLDFVNQGLDVYKDRKDILSINGYQYPVILPKKNKQDVYLYNGFSAWGFGTWKDKWYEINWDLEALNSRLNNKRQANNLLSKKMIKSLNEIVETGNIKGDVIICYHQTVSNMYSVFPFVSRVKNTGHDGSGVHGGNSAKARKIYLNQPMSDGTQKIDLPVDIMPDEEIFYSLRKHFNPTLIRKIINNPDVLLKRIKGLIQKFITIR